MSFGWAAQEWQAWVADNGRSLYESNAKVTLLGIENVRTPG